MVGNWVLVRDVFALGVCGSKVCRAQVFVACWVAPGTQEHVGMEIRDPCAFFWPTQLLLGRL